MTGLENGLTTYIPLFIYPTLSLSVKSLPLRKITTNSVKFCFIKNNNDYLELLCNSVQLVNYVVLDLKSANYL